MARGTTVFAVLNLYPYNAGHLMLVPYRHVPDYTDLTVEEVAELGAFTQTAMRTIRSVSGAHGFNIGMNQGPSPAPASPTTCTSTPCRAGAGTPTSCRSSGSPGCCRRCSARPGRCWPRPGPAPPSRSGGLSARRQRPARRRPRSSRPLVARPGPGRGHPRHGHDRRHARRGRRGGRPVRHRPPVLGHRRRHVLRRCWTCSTARWPGPAAAARSSARCSTPSATAPPTRRSSPALAWWFSGARRQPAAGAARADLPGARRPHLLHQGAGRGRRASSCDVGIVERTERLILVLVGTGLTGLGVPYALHVALWVLLAGQRGHGRSSGSSPSAGPPRARALPVPPAAP